MWQISISFLKHAMVEGCYGCPRNEDGSKELQYDCGNVTVHGPEEERHLRKGGNESKYSKGFQVGARV